jgi:hypothetical protein
VPPDHDPSEFAHDLREEGLHVFPVERLGKKPLVPWQQYQHREPSDEEFEGWRERFPGCNWGIATGVGVVVVDADTPEAVEWIEGGGIPVTGRRVTTSKGKHFYYRVTDEFTIPNSAGFHIDIRGFGGYVVAPGSVHESGHVYETETLPGWGDVSANSLPALARRDLDNIRAFNTRQKALQPVVDVDGTFLGFDATQVDPNEGGGPALELPTIEGGRNETLKSLVGRWANERMSRYEIMQRAADWNAKNLPPLGLEEVERTVQSVIGTIERKGEQFVPIVTVTPTTAREELPIYDAFALMDLDRELPPYIVDGLFRQGDNVVLAGPPKSMKSFLQAELLYSIAWGYDFLGREIPEERLVAWVQAEMPWYESKRRLAMHPLAQERHAEGKPANLFITDRLKTLAFDPSGVDYVIDELIKRLDGEVPGVLAIDSLAAVFDQDSENDNAQMMTFLRERLGRFREAFGEELTIVLLHHANKAKAAEMRADPFNALRGASALRGWYSTGMVMFKNTPLDQFAELHFEMRGEMPADPVKVGLVEGRMTEYEMPDLSGVEVLIADVHEQSFIDHFERYEAAKQSISTISQGRTNSFAPRLMAEHEAAGDGRKVRSMAKRVKTLTDAMNALIAKGVLTTRNDYDESRQKGSKSRLVKGEKYPEPEGGNDQDTAES